MKRKLIGVLIVCLCLIGCVTEIIFRLYSIPSECNNISLHIGCALIDDAGNVIWEDGSTYDTVWDIDNRWEINKIAAVLRTLKLKKAADYPSDVQIVEISFTHTTESSNDALLQMSVAYDFYTKTLYALKDSEWYVMNESSALNSHIVERMDGIWFGTWRGQSTYSMEEFPNSDFENAVFRYNLYWKKSDYPNETEHNLRLSGFKNTEPTQVCSREEAIELAAKEMQYDNPVATTFYDETCGYYMIEIADDTGKGIIAIKNGVPVLNEPIYTVIIDNMGRTVEVYEDYTRIRPFLKNDDM